MKSALPDPIRETPHPCPSEADGQLSGRQAEVLSLAGAGMSTKAIANALGLSKRTVEAYRSSGLSRSGQGTA